MGAPQDSPAWGHVYCVFCWYCPFSKHFQKFSLVDSSLSQKDNWSLHYSCKPPKTLLPSLVTYSTSQTWVHIISEYFQKSPQINSPKQTKVCNNIWKEFYSYLASSLVDQNHYAETYLFIFDNKEIGHLIFYM